MPYRVHSVILVEDEARNENVSTSRTNFKYQLTQPVNFFKRGRNYEYFARIENVRIPMSFYNINSNFNVFGWTASIGGVKSITVAPGNYTIDELTAQVQTQMNGEDTNTYTILYDEITQTVNIASTGAEDVSALTGNGWRTLGFDLTETITGASNVDGNNVAYTNTTGHLKIFVNNITSNNVYSNDTTTKRTNLQRVSLSVPITKLRNEFQFYDNHDGYFIKLPKMSNITELDIKLTDKNGNVIDLNAVPWGFQVVIYKYKKGMFEGFKQMLGR